MTDGFDFDEYTRQVESGERVRLSVDALNAMWAALMEGGPDDECPECGLPMTSTGHSGWLCKVCGAGVYPFPIDHEAHDDGD